MTEKLTTLLHDQADSVDFATPDLEVLLRAGDRRVRRRRTGGLLGAAAAVAALGLSATLLSGGDGATGTDAAGTTTGGGVSWAVGSTIHTEDGTVEVGHRVVAYVRTSAGYVVADPTGVVRSVVDGEVVEVGRTPADAIRLVSDEDGTTAGWLDRSRNEAVVLEQRRDEGGWLRTFAVEPSDDIRYPRLDAIDGGTAYVFDARGTVAVELERERVSEVQGPGAGSGVAAAEDGVLVLPTDEGRVVRREGRADVLLEGAGGEIGALSHDGRWYSQDADEPEVFDTTDGSRVAFDLDHAFATGFEWADEDTLAVLAQADPRAPFELLRCEVPAGRCTLVTELGSFEELTRDMALPVGEPLESD